MIKLQLLLQSQFKILAAFVSWCNFSIFVNYILKNAIPKRGKFIDKKIKEKKEYKNEVVWNR